MLTREMLLEQHTKLTADLNAARLDFVIGRQRFFLDPGVRRPAWLKDAFLDQDEPVPPQYQKQVETYYRVLSEDLPERK